MEKTKKQRTINKLLTLVLAFVMVFTGMGIGSWGVDVAWADELPVTIYADDIECKASVSISKGYYLFGEADIIEMEKMYQVEIPWNVETVEISTLNANIQAITDAAYGSINHLVERKASLYVETDDGNKRLENYLLPKDGTTIDGVNEIANSEKDRFYYLEFASNPDPESPEAEFGLILIQRFADREINKEPLQTAISDAEKIDSIKYHTTNDRWNGSKYSKNGFWADLQAVIDAAQAVYDNEGATQAQVDAAAKTLDQTDSDSALSKAIKNLIPTSQLNATKLYEALRPLYWISIENQATCEELNEHRKVTADNCTQASWTAYMQTREPAEAYLAKLFDKDGNATAFNKAEAAKGDQPGETEADKLADAIDPAQLVNQEKYDDAYQNWKKREAEANSLLVQYDPAKLRKADYTEASWKTYTDTYHALKEIVEYRIIGGTRADYDMLHSLYQNGDWLTNLLPQSYNKLESKGDITVTLQYTNGLAAAYPAVRTSGTDAYCGEVSLKDGNTTVKDAFDKAGIILDMGKKMTGMVPSVAWGTTDSAETPYFAVYVDDEFRGVYQTANQL